jgi:hypothetical protein
LGKTIRESQTDLTIKSDASSTHYTVIVREFHKETFIHKVDWPGTAEFTGASAVAAPDLPYCVSALWRL